MLLIIDNYDSFTYNLVQYLGEFGCEIVVVRNDEVSIDDIGKLGPKRILISPGPGTPDTAGISLKAIAHYAHRLPILGVCLGHQAIGQHFGCKLIRAEFPTHGKASLIRNDGKGIFAGITNSFAAGRYHSLILARDSIPDSLEITAETDDGIVMAIRHKSLKIEGVQFHPESILTSHGKLLLQNFLNL